jgi:hypothetical protein
MEKLKNNIISGKYDIPYIYMKSKKFIENKSSDIFKVFDILLSFMKLMMNINPELRPTAEQIVNSEEFRYLLQTYTNFIKINKNIPIEYKLKINSDIDDLIYKEYDKNANFIISMSKKITFIHCESYVMKDSSIVHDIRWRVRFIVLFSEITKDENNNYVIKKKFGMSFDKNDFINENNYIACNISDFNECVIDDSDSSLNIVKMNSIRWMTLTFNFQTKQEQIIWKEEFDSLIL